MNTPSPLTPIADEIEAGLPVDPKKAAQVALSVAASRCIDAGLTEEASVNGFLHSLRILRGLLKRHRVQ